MESSKKIEWILRVAVAGEFLGHGVFALQGKADWIKWFGQLTGASAEFSGQAIFVIGLLDLLVAAVVLFKPLKPVLLWATFWGAWTALVRPLVGLPIWDFVERFANWGAPLALWYLMRKNK
jgi:hypothetical protein